MFEQYGGEAKSQTAHGRESNCPIPTGPTGPNPLDPCRGFP